MIKNPLKNKKIFISGHRGMVGSALVKYFKKKEIKKLIFITKKKLDLLNEKKVEKFVKKNKPDIIINCAGKVGGILANSSFPVEFLDQNILIQKNLINSAYKNRVEHFINLGSSCIYPKNPNNQLRKIIFYLVI